MVEIRIEQLKWLRDAKMKRVLIAAQINTEIKKVKWQISVSRVQSIWVGNDGIHGWIGKQIM